MMFRWSIINLFICSFNQANCYASCWLNFPLEALDSVKHRLLNQSLWILCGDELDRGAPVGCAAGDFATYGQHRSGSKPQHSQPLACVACLCR
ncbi:Hypothetical protein PMT_2660 [Prochlorococcus marinus str. MIT 9313]|uniref:Uncharacterized protein n=1 Tax=Prochlorococcus marinus (strain MIT 9313) TaxID=74547 RepID=B9ES45_PROMM|nr:Hypothetical protein PMT_2660 [Prochlorococcus marinus str. MIT 9313]